MWNNAYLESRILSASPLELVNLVYQEAIRTVRDARAHLAAGRIAERSAAVSKAQALFSELTSSLNIEAGGEIGRNLARLYAYMSDRLADANFRQTDAPMAEVLALLTTLAEGFEQIQQRNTAATGVSEPAERPAYGAVNTLAGRFHQQSAVFDSAARGWSV